MSQLTCRTQILVFSVACLALGGSALAIVEKVPVSPQPLACIPFPTIGMTALCIENITLGDFVTASMAISRGDELIRSNVTFTGGAYQDGMGSPGMVLGPVAVTGTADITYFTKDKLSELRTFNAQLISLTWTDHSSFLRLWERTMWAR